MKKEVLVLALYTASSIAIVAHATVEIHKTLSQSRRDKKLMLRKENLKEKN